MTNKVPHFILFSSVTVREKKSIYIFEIQPKERWLNSEQLEIQ